MIGTLLLVVVLLVLGFLLFAVEAFVVPGFGLPGLLGLLLVAGGLAVSAARLGAGVTVVLFVASAVTGGLLLGILHRVRAWRGLVRGETERGFSSQNEEIEALAGARGEARSPLRPAGAATIGGRRVDVVAEGDFVEAGEEIVVLRVDGNRIVVRRADGAAGAEEPQEV